MSKIVKKIVSIVLVAFLMVGTVPRRADAIIPGIAAAAAALGCSEGTLVAVGGGLLAAGGIVAARESDQVKVVAAAVAGLGSAALERLSAAVNAVGPGGQYTLPIDSLLAETIGEMVQSVEDVAASGEPIELKEIGPETVLDSGFGRVELDDSTEGVLLIVFEHTAALWSDDLTIDLGYADVYKVGLSNGYNSSRQGHVLSWYVALTGISSASGEIDFCSDPYPYETGTYGEHTLAIGLGTGGFQLWVDGQLVHQVIGDYTSSLNFDGIWSGDSTHQEVHFPLMYCYESTLELPLLPGDYINEGLTPEQIAALAGTTITGDVVTNVYNPPAINPPVTWPEATDLTGVIGALQNVWNSVTQGFARVYTYLQAIVDSISTTLDPNILQEPINNLKTFITGKVPELPDLDSSGFSDREWSWMVTINHPINVSFEVLNSQTLESARPTIKGFTSGVLILLTTIYMYRRIPEIVKG